AEAARAGTAARGICAAVAVLLALPAAASAQSLEKIGRELTDIEGEARSLAGEKLRASRLRSPTYVEERLTDGELFYRLQDYVRASIIFTDIVENHSGHRAYPDAKFLLADSLYKAGDYLGARRHFRDVIADADEPSFRPYVQRALGRLIEIAIHLRDFEGVEQYFDRLNRLPPEEVEATTNYFRAKFLYNKAVPTEDVLRGAGEEEDEPPPAIDVPGLDRASEAFQTVPSGSPYYPQSRYFIGVIHTLRGEYPQAIEAFRRVLRTKATTPEHREVIDLTHLALGRLYYETDQLDQSIEVYQQVPRTSPKFDTALYEIAWAYIRMGDSTRASRALEVLQVAKPDSKYIPDAKLLRGNLLLRDGRFDDANEVFRDVRNQFGPVHRELKDMVEAHDDPQAYFKQLVRENLEAFDANAFLPDEARRWATLEEGDMARALGVLSDLSQARKLVDETEDLVDRLNGAINAPNRVSVFADLRSQRERTTALRNRLASVRRTLIDKEEDLPSGSGELASVREERRRIENVLGQMPTDGDDFIVRDDQLLGRYRKLEKQLSGLEVELMGMEARITATERYLSDTTEQGDAPEGAEGVQQELKQQREAVEGYRERIEELERQIEIGRIQVGVGDSRYQRDDRLRKEYNELVERERELLAAAGVQRPAELDRLFGRVAEVESVLDQHDARIEEVLEERVGDMRGVIEEESDKLGGYRDELTALETETEEVVGAVTYANFDDVRGRFYDLVLRADVGRIDVGWARREEHRLRIDMLTRERSRELESLDDEFREIVDESGEDDGGEQ
ncbi:MAG: tetratricopeptide repeat protein, partial [Polyangiales bacterium]